MSHNSNLENDGETKQQHPRDYILRVVGLVVLNVIGLVGMAWVAHQTTDWNTWANVVAVWVLGLASLNVVIISALTASETIETMRHQEIEMTEQKKAMKAQETRMIEQRDIMKDSLAEMKSQVDLMKDGIAQASEQAKMAERQLNLSERAQEFAETSFYIMQRAYLGIEEIGDISTDIDWTSTNPVSLPFVLKNSGLTPAKQVQISFAIMLVKPPLSANQKQSPVFPPPEGDPIYLTNSRPHVSGIVFRPCDVKRFPLNAADKDVGLLLHIRLDYTCILDKPEIETFSYLHNPTGRYRWDVLG